MVKTYFEETKQWYNETSSKMETPKYKKKGKAKTNLEKAAHPRFEKKALDLDKAETLAQDRKKWRYLVYGLSSWWIGVNRLVR